MTPSDKGMPAMRSFMAVLMIISGAAFSQPSEKKDGDQKSVAAKSGASKQGATQLPPINITVTGGTQEIKNTCGPKDCNHGPEGWYTKLWSDPVATFTGALFLATVFLVGVGFIQWQQLKATVNEVKKEFVASHPPQIVARKFQLYGRQGDRPPLVEFVVANVGYTKAKIIASNVAVKVLQSGDMAILERGSFPPYEGRTDILAKVEYEPTQRQAQNIVFQLENETGVMNDVMAGRAGVACFGFIRYQDDVGGVYETRFFRVREIGKRFLIAHKDPDYDSQGEQSHQKYEWERDEVPSPSPSRFAWNARRRSRST